MTHFTAFSRVVGLLLFASVGAAASGARAQELGQAGNLVFGAERLFGLYFDHQSIDTPAGDISLDGTQFGLGWQRPISQSGLAIPRLGIDYFIDEHLTLGGNFGLYAGSVEDNDETGILFAGRVGYALRLSSAIAFWPRGGLTIASINGDGNNDTFVFSVTLEGMFTIAPSDGWAFLLGPTLELGLAGERGEADYSEILFGVMIGIAAWFDIS